jgi:hypothetical protein
MYHQRENLGNYETQYFIRADVLHFAIMILESFKYNFILLCRPLKSLSQLSTNDWGLQSGLTTNLWMCFKFINIYNESSYFKILQFLADYCKIQKSLFW